MAAEHEVPIRDSVGAALRFVRENWRFALIVAGAGAGAQLIALMLFGPSPLWLAALATASAAVYAALLSCALNGAQAVRARLGGDALRVGASIGILGVLLGVIALVALNVVMGVLLAPYGPALKAAEGDQARLMEIMNTAIEAQPHVLTWTLAVGAALLFLLTSRFYVAAPASVDRRRIVVFDGWRMTRGNTLRIAAARLVVLAPASVLVGALQTLIGMGLGMGVQDPFALAAQAQSEPMKFTLFYTGALFVQIGLYAALEAGLSSQIYRSLTPREPQPGL